MCKPSAGITTDMLNALPVPFSNVSRPGRCLQPTLHYPDNRALQNSVAGGGRWARCNRVDGAAFERLGLVKRAGGQHDGVARTYDSHLAFPPKFQRAFDDHQDLI